MVLRILSNSTDSLNFFGWIWLNSFRANLNCREEGGTKRNVDRGARSKNHINRWTLFVNRGTTQTGSIQSPSRCPCCYNLAHQTQTKKA